MTRIQPSNEEYEDNNKEKIEQTINLVKTMSKIDIQKIEIEDLDSNNMGVETVAYVTYSNEDSDVFSFQNNEWSLMLHCTQKRSDNNVMCN